MKFIGVTVHILAALAATVRALDPLPQLDGKAFKITVVVENGFVGKKDDSYEGYVIDMIDNVSTLANFTYELKTPSGFGSQCSPAVDELVDPAASNAPYGSAYESEYLCGQDDVLDTKISDDYKTDMYWGMYYVTTDRQTQGKFSLPFKPPFQGLTMYGTATGIRDFPDLVSQQASGKQGPACVGENTAYANSLTNSIPDLETVGVTNTDAAFLAAMMTGTCDVAINAEHAARHFIHSRKESNTCKNLDGKTFSVIGTGLKYGLTQMAIGISNDVPEETIRTINFWLNTLMTCNPDECPLDGSFDKSWKKWVGYDDQCSGTAATSSSMLVFAVTMFVCVVLSFMM